MAKHYFQEDGARRIVNVVREVEGMPRDETRTAPALSSRGQAKDWIACKNDAGETIPACSVVKLVAGDTVDGLYHPYAKKPDATWSEVYGFTNPQDAVSPGKVGVCFEVGLVKYDTGTPALGEGWGVKPGQYTLSKGFPGFKCLGIWDATNKIMLAQRLSFGSLLAKTTGTVSANSTTTSYRIYAGALGSEADAGFTTVPSARNNLSTSIASGDWVVIRWINNGWTIQPLAAGSGSNGVLGKTDSSVTKGGSVTVSIYTGTPGSETDSGLNQTNVQSPFAAIGSNKWVWIATNGTGWYIVSAECG